MRLECLNCGEIIEDWLYVKYDHREIKHNDFGIENFKEVEQK